MHSQSVAARLGAHASRVRMHAQLVFSSAEHPAMALQLVDLQRPIRPLSILEFWLDNVMAAIPALAVCGHEAGMVKGYQV